MRPMDEDQRTELWDVLAGVSPAADGLVFAAVEYTHTARRAGNGTPPWQRAAEAVPPLARRLLDAETELATLRDTVARLVVGNDHGDDSSLSDLAHELKTRGIDLSHDYEAATALVYARGVA